MAVDSPGVAMGKAGRSQMAGLSPLLRRAVLLALGAYLLLSAYVLWRAAVLTPYSDEIDWIARWYAFRDGGAWRAYLLDPVNFHRIALTFGLIDLDARRLGGTNLPLILSGGLALAVMAWILARQAAASALPAMKLPAAALAAMLTLMAGSVLDAATPICVDYVHGAALAVLAIVLSEGAERRSLWWRGPLALAVAVIAGFGDGAALAVWPALAIAAARRRDWTWLAALLVVGGAYVGYYLHGQVGGAGQSAAGALAQPLDALQLALAYLMLPWSRLLLGYAWIGGLVVAVVGVAAVALAGRSASPRSRTAGGLILFTLITAVMAGLGRPTLEDPANVPLRYAVLVTPLHVGLLMLLLPWAGELWRASRSAGQALVLVVLAAMLAQHVVFATKVIRASDVNRNLVADFKAGIRTPAMSATVHPNLAHAQAMYERLERDGLFQRELHLKPRASPR